MRRLTCSLALLLAGCALELTGAAKSVEVAATASPECRFLQTITTTQDGAGILPAGMVLDAAQADLRNKAAEAGGDKIVVTSQLVGVGKCDGCVSMAASVYQCAGGQARPSKATPRPSSPQEDDEPSADSRKTNQTVDAAPEPKESAPAPSPMHKLATARALYERAVEEMDQGDYAVACPQLEEALRLEPRALGAKMTLAACFEGAGKLASAWTTYSLVEAEAAEANQAERRQQARARADALKPRLARLSVVVPDAVRSIPGLEVRRDGVPVGPAQWGIPIPVDSGVHSVVVTATGELQWDRTIKISDGSLETLVAGVPQAACPDGMVFVPGGSFLMGTRAERVTVNDYCLDRTEVTVEDYTACVGEGSCTTDGLACQGRTYAGKSARRPINCVDWAQASTYCKANGERLPTEAEWEWAARGGPAARIYPWGDDEPGTQACWSGLQERALPCVVGTTPAGASAHGIQDLAGNVWEWTASPATRDGQTRVIRGGGWSSASPSMMRASHRDAVSAELHLGTVGFRCASAPLKRSR